MGFVTDAIDSVLGTDMSGKKSTQSAINAQTDATMASNRTMKEMFDQQRADLEPWRKVGVQNLNKLNSEMGSLTDTFGMDDFQKDPGYQFRMDEGLRAIDRSAAARGGLNSGATLKALTRFGQDFASNEFTNAYNRFNMDRDQRYNKLSNLAGVGQAATGQLVGAAGNYGMGVAQNQMGLGNANAAAIMARAQMQNQLTGQAMGAGIGSIGSALIACDETLKTNIREISKEDWKELAEACKPYRFNYAKDIYGDGEWVGLMAQDLEKTKIGRDLVVRNEDGHLMVDLRKVGSLMLATLAQEVA